MTSLPDDGHRPVILVVDDDAVDRLLIERAILRARPRAACRFVQDGAEAIEYLTRTRDYAPPHPAPRPDLVLLDLNMPRLCGEGVLEVLRRDPELFKLSVVVLTTSDSGAEMEMAYRLGASAFVTKPFAVQELFVVIDRLLRFVLDRGFVEEEFVPLVGGRT
jgi:two-component system response regulator